MKRLLLAAPVLACLGAFGLVACTSNPNPGPLPPDPPSSLDTPSTSPSPTVSPPTLPPAAEGTSPKAAKAFARYYVDTINYAAATGDTESLRQLGTEACVSCDAIAKNIEKIYGSGGHIESDGWQLRTVQVLGKAGRNTVLSLGIYLSAETVVSSDGAPDHHSGHKQPMTMRIARHEQYQVARLDLVS